MVVYRRFPDKAVKDSYTPQSLKLQIVLAYLALLLLGLGATGLVPFTLFWLCLAAFGLTTLPFALATLRSDPLVGILAPGLLFGRALAIGAGILKSIPRILRPDPLAASEKRA